MALDKTSTTTAPALVNIDAGNVDDFPCCGIKNPAHAGLVSKRCWLRTHLKFGLIAKCLVDLDGKPCGYIEYLPGEYAWRGVSASGYMFIHCVWNHSKRYQRRGWASAMINACVKDAKAAGMLGVTVMTRDGPWLANSSLFLANGFQVAGAAPPDYQLLVHKFKASARDPVFKGGFDRKAARLGKGLTIIRSAQCPYIAKFAAEIIPAAEDEYHLKPEIIQLESWQEAQEAPTPYAVFAIIYNGTVLADHQVSRTRFRNIMNKLLR